jgi:hypothetical protein
MQGAETPDEVYGVDADDFAAGETGSDGVERDAVVGVVEGGDEDEGVGDVEVGVAGRETLAFEEHGRGHRELDDLEGLGFGFGVAGAVAEAAQAVEVFGEGQMVLVGGVRFDADEDGVLSYKASDVVDVAVGIVAGAAAVQPEGLLDAEVVVEGLFEQSAGLFGVAEARVALLDWTQKTFLCGEQAAGAVGVDGAAFEDDAVRLAGLISGRL